MRDEDYDLWRKRNEWLNAGRELGPGDRITDHRRASGTVTAVDTWEAGGPPSVENHGTITVRMDDGTEEHYAHFGWQRKYRVEYAD